jgi:hypothetical protein
MTPVGGFLDKARGLTKNPLGIIALFISLIYGFACLVLSTSLSNLHDSSERLPLIWFIIVFPIIILLGFVFLVVKHHEKLYAPSDYSDSESFMNTFKYKNGFQNLQFNVTKENLHEKIDIKKAILKSENIDFNDVLFSENGKKNLDLANKTFDAVSSTLSDLLNKGIITSWGFGVEAPEYYIFEFYFNKDLLMDSKSDEELIILRVTEVKKNIYSIIGIGKGIIETNPDKFAKSLKNYILYNHLPKIMKPEELKKIQ